MQWMEWIVNSVSDVDRCYPGPSKPANPEISRKYQLRPNTIRFNKTIPQIDIHSELDKNPKYKEPGYHKL